MNVGYKKNGGNLMHNQGELRLLLPERKKITSALNFDTIHAVFQISFGTNGETEPPCTDIWILGKFNDRIDTGKVNSREPSGLIIQATSVLWLDKKAPFRMKSWWFMRSLHCGSLDRARAKDWDWNITLMDPAKGGFATLKRLFGKIDISLYNRGNWNQMTQPMTKDLMTQFSFLATEQCFYKSTTNSPRTRIRPYMRPLIEMDRVFAETKNAGCGYLDYAHVTSAFEHYAVNHDPEFQNIFLDVVHYLPWVYEELNNLLLNVLCNAKHF